ncbi:MAG: glycerophosphodiester phosphodiesterase [Anaerolineae bacterium]|nr:glycerophosphodiester phosphodiesterase [Anaerolineae bacterium]
MIDPREPDRGRILVVGHRGAEGVAPENTWAAIEAGYRAGADLLELDVQLTRDGVPVLFHDFTLLPKLGDPRWLRDLAWDDVRELDAGRWFGPAFAGQRIPRLDEVLDWAKGRVALQLDLKHGFQEEDDDRLEMAVLDLLEALDTADRVVLWSWDRVALARIRARSPGVALGVNLRERVPDPAGSVLPTGARWVSVFWPQADGRSVTALQAVGLYVNLCNLFTSDYTEARRLGVDAVTATDPAAARAALVHD